MGRDSSSWTSRSAVSTPTPTIRASRRTMVWGPVSCCCSNRFWRASSICLIWLTTKPSRAMSRCSSAKVFGGSGMPSGGVHACKALGGLAQGWFEVANPQPGQGGLYPVHNARAFPHQALALAVRPLGVLFGNRGYARHAAMAPFSTQPTQEPALQQLGVESVGLCPAMFPRNSHTRGVDHVRLYPTPLKPARQPEAKPARLGYISFPLPARTSWLTVYRGLHPAKVGIFLSCWQNTPGAYAMRAIVDEWKAG